MSGPHQPAPALRLDPGAGIGRYEGYVGFRLRRIQNHLSRSFAEASAPYRLRVGAMSALAIIEANPGISQAKVGRQISMDASGVVTLVDELVERGWISRRRAPDDRRRSALYLEPLGERILGELFAILDRTEHAVLQALSSSELLMLSRTLDRIHDHCFGDEDGAQP
jgi:DNA-binding MarR family transcriptional regulator